MQHKLTNQMRAGLLRNIVLSAIFAFSNIVEATDVHVIEMSDGTEVEVRVFPAEGDTLLLGFACDAGSGINEAKTAQSLASDGIEVWMPDMLSGYMLPKLKSSVSQIPEADVVNLIASAKKTGKNIYLIASGPDTDLLLRGIRQWEKEHNQDSNLSGAILLFPRLNKGAPEPGKKPAYTDAVGATKLPLMVLEGERTPNRWGVKNLSDALHSGGSPVYTKLIPDVRGYFFKRDDPNLPEETVTLQLPGLIKASIFYLKRASK